MVKNDFISYAIPLIFLLFGFFILFGLNTYQHEKSHKQIMLNDGCQDAEIHIEVPLWDSYTICTDKNYLPTYFSVDLHTQNDIQHNNQFTLMFCIIICSIFVGLCILLKK